MVKTIVNWLVFQTVGRYFKTVSANNSKILSWKSKGLSDKSIKPNTISNKILNPSVDFFGTITKVKFDGDCLKRQKITFNQGKIVKIYIVYMKQKNLLI